MLSCHTNLVSCLFFFVVEVSSLQSSSQETIDEREVFDLQQEVRLSCSYIICIETGVTGCLEGEIMLIVVTIPFNILQVVRREFNCHPNFHHCHGKFGIQWRDEL